MAVRGALKEQKEAIEEFRAIVRALLGLLWSTGKTKSNRHSSSLIDKQLSISSPA